MEGPGWVYWSQARIVEHVVAADNKDLAGVADAGDLAARLRARDPVIVCGPDTVAIDEPATDDIETETQPADRVLATGQLALPMPTGPFRHSAEWNPEPDQRMPRPRRETTNPIEIHPEM